MKNVIPIALAAPMILIGAAYPEPKPEYYAPIAQADPVPVTYRPCRPGRGDDRCIQLYERGVRTAYARWLRERGVERDRTEVAMGGPVEERSYRPRSRPSPHAAHERHDGPRHAAASDGRCYDHPSDGGGVRGM
ncbi:MAG TPA: hypothetical protein VF704_04230 [Allosphingosinicella sp.]|jgi:hypothetical protein